ncbi:hypothetical protein GRJ2_001993300 [Grus japonensis]|uniref:Uncharacterized protein n=1 Tax=Grus japonensis TaxID=30415 RepID=A0ABC9XCA8_GRUJA
MLEHLAGSGLKFQAAPACLSAWSQLRSQITEVQEDLNLLCLLQMKEKITTLKPAWDLYFLQLEEEQLTPDDARVSFSKCWKRGWTMPPTLDPESLVPPMSFISVTDSKNCSQLCCLSVETYQ